MATVQENIEKKDFMCHVMLEHNLFIVWKAEYNLGIPIIDEHHRTIVALINTLAYGIMNNQTKKVLNPLISMIYNYTNIHFQLEEKFLEEINYHDSQGHHALHFELINKYSDISSRSIRSKNPYEFMEFLRDWWLNHICEKDLEYRKYLDSSGVKWNGGET